MEKVSSKRLSNVMSSNKVEQLNLDISEDLHWSNGVTNQLVFGCFNLAGLKDGHELLKHLWNTDLN